MGVYIKGMEMPTTCGNCWFCHAVGNDKWHCRLSGKSFSSWSVGWGNENNTGENGQHPYIRRDDCPLVPVPPHGRLRKRIVYRGEVYNAIEAARVNALDGILSDSYKDGFHDGLKRALEILANVEDAPTIIPASFENPTKNARYSQDNPAEEGE